MGRYRVPPALRQRERPRSGQAASNDQVGTLSSIYVLQQPYHGMALRNNDNTITYRPFNNYCDEATPDNFQYVVCNSVGCDTVLVYVWVLCDKIKVFTGFSPNNDQMNDFFHIDGLHNYPNNTVTIFNRWGNQVYRKEKYDNTWDGTWRTEALPPGTYFWLFDDGEGKTYSGYVEIMR